MSAGRVCYVQEDGQDWVFPGMYVEVWMSNLERGSLGRYVQHGVVEYDFDDVVVRSSHGFRRIVTNIADPTPQTTLMLERTRQAYNAHWLSTIQSIRPPSAGTAYYTDSFTNVPPNIWGSDRLSGLAPLVNLAWYTPRKKREYVYEDYVYEDEPITDTPEEEPEPHTIDDMVNQVTDYELPTLPPKELIPLWDLGIWPFTKWDLSNKPIGRHYDRKINGAAKLAQRFLIELLTAVGTDVYRPNRGTLFLTEWRKGVNTEARLSQIFYLAERQARTNLQGEETDDDPANERYVRTRITKIEITQNTVKLYLLTESRSDSTTVVVPLSTAN